MGRNLLQLTRYGLMLIVCILFISCDQLTGSSEEYKYCAVVTTGEEVFIEYCFPNEGALETFKGRMSWCSPSFHNPLDRYAQFKKRDPAHIKRVNLSKVPAPSAMPDGELIALLIDGTMTTEWRHKDDGHSVDVFVDELSTEVSYE